MRKHFSALLIVFILIGAFILRIYKIGEIPPALNWDETSIAYNAYSILKTGRDEWGKFLPLHFRAYGEYKLPAQIYASIPGVAIFGLNELGVRITPVIYGVLTVFLLYLLTKELFESKTVGLVSAFLLAISPWHIQLTRASFESSFSVMWVILGMWLLIKGFKKPRYWILSMIPFAISVYTYNSARIFTPLFLLAIAVIFRKKFLADKKTAILSAVVFLVLMLPLVPFVLSGEARARYKLVSISDDPGLIPRISEARNLSKLPVPLPRLIHNRVTYLSYYFARNYLAHFSPNFIFINGAGHKQHHVQGIGELFVIQAPFWLLGWYFLFKKRYKYRWLVLAWVLITFIPVSVTNDSIPNALRTIIAAPAYQLITALGAYELWVLLSGKKAIRMGLLVISLLILTLNFLTYLKNYYQNYSYLYSYDWQYGYKQVVGYIKEHYDDYDLIVVSRHYGEPHMFTLFFLGWDPAKFQNDPNLVRFETYDWVRVLKFDKFYFPDLGDSGTTFSDISKVYSGKRVLFIGKGGDFPDSLPRLLTVNFLNGDRAFEVVATK